MLAILLDTAALAITAAFAGVSLCCSVVDAPAMLDMQGPCTAMYFSGWYHRLRKLQRNNIAASSACSILRVLCFDTPTPLWAAHIANAVALWGIFAFTVKYMLPGNMELLAMAKQPAEYSERQCKHLISTWSQLHVFRTGLSSIAFFVMAVTAFCT